MKKINMFLPITPYTLSIAERIIESQVQDNSKKIKNILINPHGLNFNKDYWDEVYIGSASRDVSDKKIERHINFLWQITTFLKIYKQIKGLKNSSLDFYYVDLAHVLSNAIFFGFKKIVNRYVMEDGLLNYYKVTLKNKMLDKKSANIFLNYIGLHSRKFKGDITGVEMDVVNGQYVYFPDLAFKPKKSIQIPFKKLSYDLIDRVLILGQEPIVNLISVTSYLNSLNSVIDDSLIDFKDYKFYYKPHHHGKNKLANNFLHEKLGHKLHIIEDNTPIHMLVAEIKPSVVISFGSTASLNLKLILPEKVVSRVYLIRSSVFPINNEQETMFFKTGISIFELDCNSKG